MLGLAVTACSTLTTAVEHRNLQVSTRLSSSLFMDPVPPADRSVYVQVQNTNDKGNFGLGPALEAAIEAQGWTVVSNADAADVILQVGVLQAGKIKTTMLQSALVGGYGSVLGTAAVGAGAAALSGANITVIGGTALGLGTADYVGGLLVKDETFSAIADVRVMQRELPGQIVTLNSKSATRTPVPLVQATPATAGTPAAAGSTAAVTPVHAAPPAAKYKIQQTRVACFVNRTNLRWADAMPAIRLGLVNTLAGLF
ncbi:MAG TPA: complement resistance protein TraT [Nevskiaceae bacterium]|nr:complement resistance protein TraT [Nevskiaceae bacterium]